MIAKLLTPEEVEVIKDIKKSYEESIKEDTTGRYINKRDKDIELYLRSIGYPERLAEYLKDKWYIKFLRKIFNRGKKDESSEKNNTRK